MSFWKTLAVAVTLIALSPACKKRYSYDEKVTDCLEACLKYGAEYSRITDESNYVGDYNYECWCRRPTPLPSEQTECASCEVYDTDHGEVCKTKVRPLAGGEPLRIW